MADVIWPNAVRGSETEDLLRPFHCLLLMPFDSKRFEDLARELEKIVREVADVFLTTVQVGPAVVERLDWVNAAGTIQWQLWERIQKANLIFCDLTGQN